MYLVLLPILGLFTIMFNRYDQILEVKEKNPTDRPILEKQGRVRGNRTIFKVGLGYEISTSQMQHDAADKKA